MRKLYWLVFALWLATALPILAWNVLTLQIPMWPHFSSESTPQGVVIWLVLTLWLYVTPVLLYIRRSKS